VSDRLSQSDKDRLKNLLEQEPDLPVEAGRAFAVARRDESARGAGSPASDVEATSTAPDAEAGLVEHIAVLVRGGDTPTAAARRLSMIEDSTAVDRALKRFQAKAEKIRDASEPGGAFNRESAAWYLPGESPFWDAYRDYLIRRGWYDDDLEALDQASTKTLSLLQHPGSELIRTRGLVVGYVQSGKTANFTALIAKAADAGYRLFIVLSGISNILRDQTQRRLDEELVASHPEDWFRLTGPSTDFEGTENTDFLLGGGTEARILAVVKKNGDRLRSLRSWLLGARPDALRKCPILIIDDEADQASPNAAAETDERTAINGILVGLLRGLPKAAYVGYTATPYANLLIDPSTLDDLYPRDFILDLPMPAGYFGPERIFGREAVSWDQDDQAVDGLNVIRPVPKKELKLLQPGSAKTRHDFKASVTPSLEQAVRQFWMAAAALRVRGRPSEHASMLVHTSMYRDVHESFRKALENCRDGVLRRLSQSEQGLLDELRKKWQEEKDLVPSISFGLRPINFEDLVPHLKAVVEETEIIVENSRSADRINYNSGPKTYIVIGGNVLSRGLTLHGLIVSFFIRTASAYDTLMQMGRWFGFRRGYEDLPRVWMSDELRGYFFDLATVEREIRVDISRYDTGNVSPRDFGVRIRQHPQLAITSKLKMQHAVHAEMSFSGHTLQTTLFEHTNREWLAQNIDAARSLIAGAKEFGGPVLRRDRPHLIFPNVPVEYVLKFLDAYQIHKSHFEMPADMLMNYIDRQNADGDLLLWNVALMTRAFDARLGELDFGLASPVPLINRARFLRGDLQYASIKTLISAIDEAVDLDVPTEQLRELTRGEIRQKRAGLLPDRGLLAIYPISRNSRPMSRSDALRRSLEAVDNVVGIELVFPEARRDTPGDYMTVDLSAVPREVLQENDEADEAS